MALMLIADDHKQITSVLEQYATKEGYRTLVAGDGRVALDLFHANKPDIILLDVMMPVVDGFEVCREIRKTSAVPIIMITARGEDFERIMGLDIGADDYIVKPFSMSELSARIRAVLRRLRPGLAEDRVRRGGQEIHLGPTEFRLLDYLMQHPGRVFSREQLLDAVWGSDVYVEARTVDVHVGRLRKALNREAAADPIRTVRSAGYSLDLEG